MYIYNITTIVKANPMLTYHISNDVSIRLKIVQRTSLSSINITTQFVRKSSGENFCYINLFFLFTQKSLTETVFRHEASDPILDMGVTI
jgi:hypothetical protein